MAKSAHTFEHRTSSPESRPHLLASAAVRGRSPSLASIAPLVAGGVAVLSLVAAAGTGAQSPVDRLRAHDAAVAARSHSAVLELYGLDSALASARVSAAAAEARLTEVRRERDKVERRLTIARRTLAISERHLGERLRELYENGSADPVAVLLGAKSLDQAISTLDGLHRFASQDRSVIRQARAARAELRRLSRRLAARETELEQERARAAADVATLQRAAEARRAYLAALRRDRALTARRIGDVVAAAQAARARSDRLTPPIPVSSAPAPVPTPSPATGGGRTLTVVATGYAIQGTTATGLPTSWGVVAVDPSVIPLGTRMTIPGYGEGVAADVGSAIQGAIIDLWFPSEADALAWGRRTVTITLH